MTTKEQQQHDKLAAAVRGLTREVEGTRATAQQALDLAQGSQRAIVAMSDLQRRRAAQQAPAVPEPAPERPALPLSWLTVDDPAEAEAAMAELVEWLGRVYVHYLDDPADLAACWAWHPSVVAELLACQAMWAEAYEGKQASAARVADWHDRWRPGAAHRVKHALAECGLPRHAPATGDRAYRPGRVPGAGQAGGLAAWWVDTHGAMTAPAPSPALVAETEAQRVEVY